MKTETRFILSAIVCAAALAAAAAATAAPAGGVVVTSVTVRVSKDSSLLVPHSVGEIRFPDWSAKKAGEKIVECRPGWGMTYRMLAVLGADGGDSVAMVQKGARQYATRLRAKAGPGRDEATLESVYDPTDDEGDSPKIPFETMVVRFRGGWFEAAKVYRDVVKDEPWLRQARARDFGRLREVSMWFWNRRSSDIVIPPVEKFQQDSGTPAALSWYWWHTPPYDTGYPFYWPPREGEENFRAGVRRLNRSGIYCQAYINGMCWDVNDPGWARGGERCVRRRADGTFKSTEWNRFDRHRLADMCGEAPEFQSILRDQVRRVLDCGFDSQYLDCIGNGGYGCCWSKEHVHPKGGGRHMVDDFAKFVRTVRSEHPGKGFCTEDVNESYLELFDSFIVTAPSYERFSGAGEVKVEKVPVFPAIYHGAYAGFGNYATIDGILPWDPLWDASERWTDEKDWPRLFPDQFRVEVARGVVWGLQPTVHNFRSECAAKCPDDYRFMVDTARFYHANLDLLFDGEMLSPGRLACARKKVEFINRGVYSKKGEYAVATHVLPVVFHSVWRSPSGRVAATLCNWTNDPQSYSLATPDGAADGTLPPRSWAAVPISVDAAK